MKVVEEKSKGKKLPNMSQKAVPLEESTMEVERQFSPPVNKSDKFHGLFSHMAFERLSFLQQTETAMQLIPMEAIKYSFQVKERTVLGLIRMITITYPMISTYFFLYIFEICFLVLIQLLPFFKALYCCPKAERSFEFGLRAASKSSASAK